jgi:hypothetical protein
LFFIVETELPAAAIQVMGSGGVPVGEPIPFVPVPGTEDRAAVVFVPDEKHVRCSSPFQNEVSIRVLGEDGTDLGCADIGSEGGFAEGER